MATKITTTQESPTGRNQQFKKGNGHTISRADLVKEIEQGKHPNHHVRNINNVKTPVSNPDGKSGNNLG